MKIKRVKISLWVLVLWCCLAGGDVSFAEVQALLTSSVDSVYGNDLHGGLLQRVPATVPRGPDNAVIIPVFSHVLLAVFTPCTKRGP